MDTNLILFNKVNKYKLDDIIVKFEKIKFISFSLIINKLMRAHKHVLHHMRG